MKRFILLLMVFTIMIQSTSATWDIVGSGGSAWSGNVTHNNTIEESGYVKTDYQNYILNPSFEDGTYDLTGAPNNWTDLGGNDTTWNSTAYIGSYSVEHTDNLAGTRNYGWYHRVYDIVGGTQYTIEYYNKVDSVVGTGLHGPAVKMTEYNGGSYVQNIEFGWVDYVTDWIIRSHTWTPSTSTDNIELRTMFYQSNGTAYWDAFKLYNTSRLAAGNVTRNIFDSGENNITLQVRIQGNNPVAGTNVTVAINKSTDQSSWTWEELGIVTTVGDFDITYDVTGAYRYVKWDFYLQTNNISQTSMIYNGSLRYELLGTPTPTNLDHTKGNTWVNHTWDPGSGNVTDSYNVSINGTWHNSTTNEYYNNTPIPEGNWSNITVWAWNNTYSELSASSVSENVQTRITPIITTFYPADANGSEVSDTRKFNVTTDQTTNCTWYINGSQVQYNSSATEHTYTNTSLKGGHWNFTAVVNNTNGTDSQTWLFEVGADSIDMIILSEDDTNLSCLIRWNVTRIGSNVTHWNVSYSNTTNGYTYYFRFDNLTEIMSQTATGDNQTLWFNSSTLLPTGIYRITSTPSVSTSHLLTSSFETSLSLAGILVIIAIVIGTFSMLTMLFIPTSKMDFEIVGTAAVSVIVLLALLYIAIMLCNSIANA